MTEVLSSLQPTRVRSGNVCRRNSLILLKRPSVAAATPESSDGAVVPVLNSLPLRNVRGLYLQFESFDDAYLSRLRAGDFRTQEHFCAYFGALIRIKLRSRTRSADSIEDIRQETFSRVLVAVRDGKIQQPERLGAYVNSICNHVALEYFRSSTRSEPLGEEEQQSLPAAEVDMVTYLSSKETQKKVREILDKLSERDRRLLREVLLEERDKDEVCRDFGIDREYLRVLLHRAKQAFKAKYLKQTGNNPPDFATA